MKGFSGTANGAGGNVSPPEAAPLPCRGQPSITFVNHASVLISNGAKSVLSDPWYFGPAFFHSWRLIVETSLSDILRVLDATDYIWISHEHADHFSPEFFLHPDIKRKMADNNIKMLFQATRDRRIAGFLSQQGCEVTELKEGQRFSIASDFDVYVQKSGFRDSGLILKLAGKTICNLNDCAHLSAAQLKTMRHRYGTCDLLLTQFSYASWKGGKDNAAWRKQAAREKIETMLRQARLLGAKRVMPFASFFYFANEMNAYLNDSINTPKAVRESLDQAGLETVFMTPMQTRPLDELRADAAALEWWESRMSNVNALPKLRYEKSCGLEALQALFAAHQQRLFKKNSRLLVRLLSWLPFLNAFRGARICLTDLDSIVVRYSIFDGLAVVPARASAPVVAMHSAVFRHILEHDYGFGSLGVGGCFEADNRGFATLAKNLALDRLNCMGLTLSTSLWRRPGVVVLFFRMLGIVNRRARSG